MSVDDLLAAAQARYTRLSASEAWAALGAGALVVDVRPIHQRQRDGEVPGAVVVDRNVIEWRLDPSGDWRMPEATGVDHRVILLCNEGCSSQLAAVSLLDLGLVAVTDVIGGFQAWLEAGLPTVPAGSGTDRTAPESVNGAGATPGAGSAQGSPGR